MPNDIMFPSRNGEDDVPQEEQRRRMIRRLIRVHRDAVDLNIKPAIVGLELVLVATERAAADRTPNPST